MVEEHQSLNRAEEKEWIETAKEPCMRVRKIFGVLNAVALTLLFVALVSGAHAQKSETSSSALPPWNDNALIAIQKKGGDPLRPGEVKIEFYGHDSFKITSPDRLTILTDPWRNDSTGLYPKWFVNQFPPTRVDIVLSTHAHFDHDAVDRPQALMVLERLVGEFSLGDVSITGLAEKHQCEATQDQKPDTASSAQSTAEPCPPNNRIDLDNSIQIVATGGLRIAIWGDNRAVPEPSLDRYLKNVDVLILPVETVLTRPEADAIVHKYDPKALIPAHYFVEGLTTKASGVDAIEGWVAEQEKDPRVDVHRLKSAELTLSPADLKAGHRRIYYFGSHFKNE